MNNYQLATTIGHKMMYNYSKIEKIFNFEITKNGFMKNEATGKIPLPQKENGIRYWDLSQLPEIGERFGYIKKANLKKPKVITVFSSKGGCFKSTLAYNIIRTYGLHNLKICCLGLDFQCDITNQLSNGYYSNVDEDSGLEQVEQKSVMGLYDYYTNSNIELKNLIQKTEIPTIDYIPETPSLNMLSELVSARTKRENWLKDNVVSKLKKDYDIIVIDLGPSWNMLTSNAIVASDLIISPIECKIFHYQNIKNFIKYLEDFQKQMDLKQKTVYVPTRFSNNKKLSTEIRKYYLANIKNCTSTAIREANAYEEANSLYQTVMETSPKSLYAQEMRELMIELFDNYIADTTGKEKWH